MLCQAPNPFPTEPPVSRLDKMILLKTTNDIAAKFNYSDDAMNKSIERFLSQMRMAFPMADNWRQG
jgi:hypothetical protein